jgi:plasmid stability protein
MGRLVQVRDVPEDVHRTLKSRAAQSGISLSEYLRVELARLASLPSPEEVRARLRAIPPRKEPKLSPEKIIRQLRGPLR